MTLLQVYLKSPQARRALSKRPGDQGFSLIELVVVVAILAILAAVALPNFLGVSKDGQIAAAKNTLATAIKECSVKETRSNVGTIGEAGEAGASAPIQALGASLNGYNLVLLDGAVAGVGADEDPISLGGDNVDDSCYSLAAVSPTESLPTFGIAFDGTAGTTEKTCYVPDGDTTSYREGCFEDDGSGSPTNVAVAAGESGVW